MPRIGSIYKFHCRVTCFCRGNNLILLVAYGHCFNIMCSTDDYCRGNNFHGRCSDFYARIFSCRYLNNYHDKIRCKQSICPKQCNCQAIINILACIFQNTPLHFLLKSVQQYLLQKEYYLRYTLARPFQTRPRGRLLKYTFFCPLKVVQYFTM